jgi:hypothetical protein
MATGIAVGRANASIDATVAVGTWIKLHIGDPGAAGTSAPAGNTTRQQATFGAASAGAAVTTAALEWTSVSTSEDYTHFSMWSASTAGTFLWSGTVTANAVTSGDTFRIPSGSLSLTMTGAS